MRQSLLIASVLLCSFGCSKATETETETGPDENDGTVVAVNGAIGSGSAGAGTGNDVAPLDEDDVLPPTIEYGFVISDVAGQADEAGGVATFDVSLKNAPSAPVTISLTSSDSTEGLVSTPTLTFTASDWGTPQTVSVTGVDDATADDVVIFSVVTGPAVSADPHYSGLDPRDVSLANNDDDVFGLVVGGVGGQANEGGGVATFEVSLRTAPTADVTIGLTSSDLTEGTVSPASLTFTSSDWNVPQTVSVTGVDDTAADDLVVFSVVTAPAVSADPVYSGFDASDVSLSNHDDEPATLAVLLTSGTSYVKPDGYTKAKVWVVGAGGGGAASEAGGGGGAGGVAYKDWTGLSDGTTIAYAIGAAGLGTAYVSLGTDGGASTATIGGTTITANGGAGGTLDMTDAPGGTFSGGDGGAIGGVGFGVTDQDQGGGGGGAIGGNPGSGLRSGGSDGGNGGAFSDVSGLGQILTDLGHDLVSVGIGGDGGSGPTADGTSATGFGCGGGASGWYGGPAGAGLFGGGGGGGAAEGGNAVGGNGGQGAVVVYLFK